MAAGFAWRPACQSSWSRCRSRSTISFFFLSFFFDPATVRIVKGTATPDLEFFRNFFFPDSGDIEEHSCGRPGPRAALSASQSASIGSLLRQARWCCIWFIKKGGRVILLAWPDFSNFTTAEVKPAISSLSSRYGTAHRRSCEHASAYLGLHFKPKSYHSRHFDRTTYNTVCIFSVFVCSLVGSLPDDALKLMAKYCTFD